MKALHIKTTRIAGGFFLPVLGPLMQNRWPLALLASVTAMLVVFTAAGIATWQCPLKSALGIACPGCGLTRAMVMFVQGHWRTSIQIHAFAPVVLGVGFFFAAGSVLPQQMRRRVADRLSAFERRTAFSALMILSVLIYWVFRTIDHL